MSSSIRKRGLPDRLPWLIAAAAIAALVWVVRDREQIAHDHLAATEKVTALTTQVNDLTELRSRCAAQLDALSHEGELRRLALSLLEQPGTRITPLATQKGYSSTANVVWHGASNRAFVVCTGLKPEAGQDYELWVIHGKTPVPAGLLRADATGAVVALIDPDLMKGPAPTIAVTKERTGGERLPVGPIVLAAQLDKS